MSRYSISDADRKPLPASYTRESRHLGWREDELERPFAHFYADAVAPIQRHVREALSNPGVAAEFGYDVVDAVSHLSRPGYGKLETGWTRTDRGMYQIACFTDMPGVTAEMWDWWFGWHATDTARYKLWHPEAHAYSDAGEDRSGDRTLSYRQRYIGNVSYIDEYLGTDLQRLTVRFIDPRRLGFDDVPGTTHICARVGLSELPMAAGWLVHQVRATEHGAEMRSRFWLGDGEILRLPPTSVSNQRAAAVMTSRIGRAALQPALPRLVGRLANRTMAVDILAHCAQEMNHLAQFLPGLFEEFKDMP
ncbi:MAG: DAPG hydrolase family protein [Mycobacterium sp.]